MATREKTLEIITSTNLPLREYSKGKVRDIYECKDKLLIVATDRISTYDVVHPNGIPEKGKILTALTLFWFDFLDKHHVNIDNHLVCAEIPYSLHEYKDVLEGRSMIVNRAEPIPIECIVRGYLYGSAWKDYEQTKKEHGIGKVCGIELPNNLVFAEKLPKPIFCPSTKALQGHDENITFEKACEIAGKDIMEEVREYSLEIYKKASEHAKHCELIIADTKFEFGIRKDKVILIDEVLTPDSSRFWCAHDYEEGKEPISFDKQFVRNYVSSIGWNKKPPAPILPENIVNNTRKRYIKAYEALTEKRWAS